MFALDNLNTLTVYNGTEDKYDAKKEPKILPGSCCSSVNANEGDCNFQLEPDKLKKMHRQMLMGEPFLTDDGSPHGKSEWTPLIPLEAIKIAIRELNRAEDLEALLNTELSWDMNNLYMAITLIRFYLQLNYTGPDILDRDMDQQLEKLEKLVQTKFKPALDKLLQVDGIELDRNAEMPVLLLLAGYYLSSVKSHCLAWPFYLIWRFRIDFLHQRVLTRRSRTLIKKLKYLAESYIEWNKDPRHFMSGILTDVHGAFLCEISEMLVFYYDGILAEKVLSEAMKALGLVVEYSGKLGFRTKFQQIPKPQTVVNIQVKNDSSNKEGIKRLYKGSEDCIPKSQALNDDTRLERLRLVDEDSDDEYPFDYRDVHQLILLGKMLHQQVFQCEKDLKREEQEALIDSIVRCPVNWCGRVSALVARSDLEKMDRRAIDRCLRQLEEINKFVSRPTEHTGDTFRQYLFFGSGHPMKSELRIQLGFVLISLDHWKEALKIFTELGAFEQMVRCYEMINLPHKAEEIIRKKIAESGKTPKLLVLLGDVTRDISHYEEAWTLSEEKSMDSQIRLGHYYFKRDEYQQAIVHLKRAVELAPLEYPSWLRLAWCCYKTEDYNGGFQAYLRAANLEYDSFQVWNNLANCALKLKKKDYALRAYKLAVKCNYDEWKVWSNILQVATAVDELNDSLQAYNRILDLNVKFLDEAALEAIVEMGLNSAKPTPTVAQLAPLAQLMARVTTTSSRSANAYLLYARVLMAYMDCDDNNCEESIKRNNCERGLFYYEKSLLLMRQNPMWQSDLVAMKNITICIAEFRKSRQRAKDILDESSVETLKRIDALLKRTAHSHFKILKDLLAGMVEPNRKLLEVFNATCDELKSQYYG